MSDRSRILHLCGSKAKDYTSVWDNDHRHDLKENHHQALQGRTDIRPRPPALKNSKISQK